MVTTQLPDPLASLFVPIDAQSQGFDGAISVRDGLELHASLETASDAAAGEVAATLRQSIPTLPAVARTMDVTVESHTVTMTLEVTPDELSAALHPIVALPPVEAVKIEAKVDSNPEPKPEPKPELKPEGPQVIRIFGLDEGVREIILKPKNP